MPGFIYKGPSNYGGASFYLPEWYAELYASVDGVAAAYMAGWMREPGASLIDGPTMRQMTYFGSGADPTVSDSANLGGEPAFGFPGKLIDTGHPRSADFTIVAMLDVRAAILAGGADQIMHANGGANGDLVFQMTPTRVPALTISSSLLVGGGSTALTDGPHVVAATCRNTGGSNWRLRTYADGLVTPLAEANVTGASTLGGSWVVGGARTVSSLNWGAALLGWMIFDRDMSVDAADAASLNTAMAAAKAWMS